MINLFRKFRRQQISSKQYKKYLIYIIGEVFLVVIGILIALQINNWNEGRKMNTEKLKILVELQNEFKENQNALDRKIDLHKFISSQTDDLVNLFNPIPKKADIKKIDTLIITMAFMPEFKATTSVLNSEKLALVQDSKLKSHIADWKFSYEEYRQQIKITYDLYYNHIYPFISENYQIKNAGGIFFESNKSFFDVDIMKILSNSAFENHVFMRSINAKSILNSATKLKEIQKIIIKNIETVIINE
tara:strand:+ start:49354 stop:50091 length:738 start_codon:yes stop_codon:yes gene_type:complete